MGNGRWKPGQSGNPAGRPNGSRNKLSESVVQALLEDWGQHGEDLIARTRKESPATYLRIVSSLLPKEAKNEQTFFVDFVAALERAQAAQNEMLEEGVIDLDEDDVGEKDEAVGDQD